MGSPTPTGTYCSVKSRASRNNKSSIDLIPPYKKDLKKTKGVLFGLKYNGYQFNWRHPMLNPIDNTFNDEYISKFNKKIKIYNKKPYFWTGFNFLNKEQKDEEYVLTKLHLLYEINHMHMRIKKLYIDSDAPNQSKYAGIINFMGVGTELTKFNLPCVEGLFADNILTSILNDQSILSEINKSGDDDIQSGILRSNKINNLDNKEYLYALKPFKQTLLNKLTDESKDHASIKSFRKILRKVNHEITITEEQIERLKNRNIFSTEVMETPLYKKLSQLNNDKMQELINNLHQRHNLHLYEKTNNGRFNETDKNTNNDELKTLLPELAANNPTFIGGGNNINLKISNPDLVLQLGTPEKNQGLINRLEQSCVNDYLSPSFFLSTLHNDFGTNLVLTKLYEKGDLRAEREELSPAEAPQIEQHATSRINQLTSICQKLLQENVAHSDIKLANFLIDDDGNIIIADKKSLIEIDSDGNIPKRGLNTTAEFAPPEYKTENTEMNAEAFMVYQLGLALYDEIVLPKVSSEPNDKPWYSDPLNFDVSIFNSSNLEIKELIISMTDKDPNNRPSLLNVQKKLAQVFPSDEFKQKYRIELENAKEILPQSDKSTDPNNRSEISFKC